ncbi:MAG TPA: flagellar filament capping protein FliD [Phycisphaerae bacterium]|nr:flagellar filament capping protein FliD [Phycisphaerae bacterium]
MSSISLGTGLVSGLPINDLVDSLIALQRRPITQLQTRLQTIGTRRAALLQLSAQLLSVQNTASRLTKADFFRRTQAASSNESVLLASAGSTATPGQYTFTVRSLAAAHQLLSSGFASSNATPLGAGTLTIEGAQGLLNRSTPLSQLNGEEGVHRGKIRITDRSGASAVIDLATASTINDAVTLINADDAVQIVARIEGDHLVLTDQTGLAAGTLAVAEVNGGRAASELGILGASATGEITGSDLVSLSESTRLSLLNDGNGVRRLRGQSDFSAALADGTTLSFDLSDRLALDTPLAVLNRGGGATNGSLRLTTRAGQQVDVDLSAAQTIGDVKTAIESAATGVTVNLTGSQLTLVDSSAATGTTKIEEIGTGTTAANLGLLGTSTTGTITGKDIYFVDTLGDLVRIINTRTGNDGKLTASLAPNGLGLVFTDNTTGVNPFQLTALNGSHALDDLGLTTTPTGNTIQSRRLLAGLNTVLLRSLNGGSGVQLGQVQLTDRAGTTATIDLSSAQSLQDVLDAINAAPTAITTAFSSSGLGIELTDTSGGAGNLAVSDLTGTSAADLHIAANSATTKIASGNLQRQYLSSATLLADLNNGRGIARGSFRITNSNGASAVVDLTQGNEQSLQDVIDEINSRGISVTARINDTGDGLLLEDTAGGPGKLTIGESGGTTAQSLGILGTAAEGQNYFDGSLETRITVTAADTLDTLLAKIKSTRAPVSAAIINDNSGARSYRLSLTSTQSGRIGELAIDAGTTSLSFDTLSQARDATVLFGPPDAASPLVLSSATNTLTDAVGGLRLDLTGTSTTPVTVTVSQDIDSLFEDVSGFVSAVNEVISSIDRLSSFDSETQARGILFADPTARRIRDRLIGLTSRSVAGLAPTLNRLSQIGISLTGGASISLNEEKFRAAYERDPAGVEYLFTTAETGFGPVIEQTIKQLTDTETGAIALQDQSLQSSEDLLNNRITQLETLVERRRQRLLAQFAATESAIARLQSQQTALSGLSGLSSGFSL